VEGACFRYEMAIVDAASGKRLSAFTTDRPPESFVVFGRILVYFAGHEVIGFDLDRRDEVWRREVPDGTRVGATRRAAMAARRAHLGRVFSTCRQGCACLGGAACIHRIHPKSMPRCSACR
jgi:hypothetical protein